MWQLAVSYHLTSNDLEVCRTLVTVQKKSMSLSVECWLSHRQARIEVGWEKVACWSTKAAISLKCVEIEEKLQWKAYRKSLTIFRTVPSPTPTASPFPRLGVRNPTPKLQLLLSQERLMLGTSNLASMFTGSIRTQAREKFWRKGSVGVSRDGPIFWVPPMISGTVKATNFQFCTDILSIYRNKCPLQISGKIAVDPVNNCQLWLNYSQHFFD